MNKFNEIYQLVKDEELQKAKELLFDSYRSKIKEVYSDDLNHAYYVLGDICYRQNDFMNALTSFKKSLYFELDDYDAMFAIGDCYDALGQSYKAYCFYNRVYDRTDSYAALYNIANAYYDLTCFEQAIDAYQEIPSSTGEVYESAQKNIKLARQCLEKQKCKR